MALPRLIRRIRYALAGVAMASCTSFAGDRALGPEGESAPVQVGVRFLSGTQENRSIALWAFYLRPGNQRVPLAQRSMTLGPGEVTLPLSMAVSECLSDLQLSGAAACPVYVAVALRDEASVLLDSTVIGPLQARAGTRLTAPVVNLAVRPTFSLIGRWAGSMTQQSGPLGSDFDYEVSLQIEAGGLRGTMGARSRTNSSWMARFEGTASVQGDTVTIVESRIQNSVAPSGAFWCSKTARLVFRDARSRLTGTWTASGCSPGTMDISRR